MADETTPPAPAGDAPAAAQPAPTATSAPTPSADSTAPAAAAAPATPAAIDPNALNAMIAEATAANAAADAGEPSNAAPSGAANADQDAIDELLRQASFDDASTASASPQISGAAPAAAAAAPTMPFDLPGFQQVMQDAQVSSIDLLRDVELNVKIELGRSRMLVEDVLKLVEGSVVELDKLAGDPVDVFVNDRLVARGEVLVLNDNFCVRVNEIVTGAKEEGQ